MTPATAAGFRELIDRLEAAGWRVTDRSDEFDMVLPAGLDFDSVYLTKRVVRRDGRDGAPNLLSVQVDNDGVLAVISFANAPRACRET